MIKQVLNNSKRKWIYEIDSEKKRIVEVCIKPQRWKDSSSNIVIPFSINSSIYDGINGDLKIKSLLNAVKSYANNKILILLCEGAHLNVLSMKYNSIEQALKICHAEAIALFNRFKNDFSGCEVLFWQDFIIKDSKYQYFKSKIISLYNENRDFRDFIQLDVKKLRVDHVYLPSNSDSFYQNTQLDFIEMMVGLLVKHDKNYKVVIYPGSIPSSLIMLQEIIKIDMIFVNASIKCKDLTLC